MFLRPDIRPGRSWANVVVLLLFLRKLISRLKSTGKPITYVDIDIPLNELNSDGIHPT
jgi:hypothetical protein